jgi:D-glycero-alpha-D-manno-heptose-7-phosphate kinase
MTASPPPHARHRVLASAPARIDLAGGWTDVPPYTTDIGGAVCNIAIALRATADVTPTVSAEIPDGPLLRAAWTRAGAPAVSIRLHADFPVGSGLGGSSAAGVALAAALATITNHPLSPAALAERSRSTETETMGLAGGCQDHYAAAFGGALLLHCGAATSVEQVPLHDDTIAALERRAFVAYTGASRMSANTITAVLDAYRAGEPRTCHALAQMAALAPQMASALRTGDLDHLGTLLSAQWAAQRALHPSITTPLIDRIVHDTVAAGALGVKALGASGGGCVLVLARADRVDAVRETLSAHATIMPLQIARDGVRVQTLTEAH